MTEKNRQKLELKQRRIAMGKLWTGYKPLVTPSKREQMERLVHKHKRKEEYR